MSYRPYRRQGINPIWIIIGVNFVVWIAAIINPGQILSVFALIPSSLSQHPWTIFTYMFVHQEFYHILFNMITLYFFGTFAIVLVGETAFLTTYFVGGLVGGLFFVLFATWLGGSNIAVIGASGAIYSLGGLLMVMRPNTKVITFPIPIPMPLWVAVLIGFVLVSFIPGVAWQAHLGGIVYGAAIGFYFRRREYRR